MTGAVSKLLCHAPDRSFNLECTTTLIPACKDTVLCLGQIISHDKIHETSLLLWITCQSLLDPLNKTVNLVESRRAET